MYNIKKGGNTQCEYNNVINQMTRELKNSEYSYKTSREIIIGGIRGWKKRLQLREKKRQAIYRPAHKTVRTRERKKLPSRGNWYKNE